jgi:hypothetical protein
MFTKMVGGVMVPASDLEAEKLSRFKTGDLCEGDFKLKRNGKFHGKVFAFFGFCFEHWDNPNSYQDEQAGFDVFRSELTCLAGYSNKFYTISGSVRLEAKSLAYGNMSQEEFEHLYNALIQAAMNTIFKGADESIYTKLMSFF